MLDLTVIKVTSIPKVADTYVEITFNKESFQTLLIKNSQNPIWSEKMLLPLRGMDANEYLSSTMLIELKDKAKNIIGSCTAKVGDFEFDKDEFWTKKFDGTEISIEYKTKLCRRKQVLVHDHLKFLDNINKMELDVMLLGVKDLPEECECYAKVSFHENSYQTLNSNKEQNITWELPMRFSMANLTLQEYFHETIVFEVHEKGSEKLIGTFNLRIADVEYENHDIFSEVLNTSKLNSIIQFQAQVKDLEYLQFQPLPVQTSKKVQVMDQFKFLDKLEKLHLYVRINELKNVKDPGQYSIRVLLYKVCHSTSIQDVSNLKWPSEVFHFYLKGLQTDTDQDNYFKQIVTFQLYKNGQVVGTFSIKLMDVDYNVVESVEEKFEDSEISCSFDTLIHE